MKGKSHSLGSRIPIPEKCGELVCEEGLVAPPSPLLSDATEYDISHPEMLTLSFKSIYPGSECCVLEKEATSSSGQTLSMGSMVEESIVILFVLLQMLSLLKVGMDLLMVLTQLAVMEPFVFHTRLT